MVMFVYGDVVFAARVIQDAGGDSILVRVTHHPDDYAKQRTFARRQDYRQWQNAALPPIGEELEIPRAYTAPCSRYPRFRRARTAPKPRQHWTPLDLALWTAATAALAYLAFRLFA
jgi:hypothetical protein